jgi:ATP-dependent DNA helicase RecG
MRHLYGIYMARVSGVVSTVRDQVVAWAALGESETQEFKISTGQRSEAAKTLCAFLNLKGGRILFGVDLTGSVVGQDVTDSTLAKIYREIEQFDPEITPSIERVAIGGGREVVVLSTGHGRYKPYRYKGQPYRRVGTVTTGMGREEYQRLFSETSHATARWEIEPATLPVGDLDLTEITRTLEDAVRRGRISDPLSRDPIDVLRGFGLIKDKTLLNAAVVLFGLPDRLLPGYTQCLLKMARFDGMEKSDRMTDERQIHGHAFALLRHAEDFLRDHLRVTASIEKGIARVDEPEIPIIALREALANAISHREYATGAGSISVNIFDDRVEVTSIGPLHFGLSVADLYRPHESQPWNPLIAGTLYRRGIIDSLGSGTLRMLRACRDAGLFEPDIQDSGTSVKVDFPRAGAPPARFHGLDLDDNSHELLRLIVRNGSMALRELVASLPAMSERDVRDELQKLRQVGVLEPQGHGRGARWVLAPPPG